MNQEYKVLHFLPGTHLLIDFYECGFLTDAALLKNAMISAAHEAGAHVINAKFHVFPDRAGVTGVVLLAESHISIHTWPEIEYAAIDIFMCGKSDPNIAARYLEKALTPKTVKITNIERGKA